MTKKIAIYLFILLAIIGSITLARLNPEDENESFGQSTYKTLDRLPGSRLHDIIKKSGIKGGILVHLGCGNGEKTAEMAVSKSFVVQGLDRDEDHIKAARNYLLDKELYGTVSVMRLTGEDLPYAEDLVNLLVAEDLQGIDEEEIMRVLVPGGVAIFRKEKSWMMKEKPGDPETDHWQNFLYSSEGNAVSKDKKVGPPRRLKWVAGPRWFRTHEMTPRLLALVSAGGRLYYVFDEGQTGIGSPVSPDRWTLICRDAYNGLLLWKRRLPTWGNDAWNKNSLRQITPFMHRRIAAVEDKLYVTLDYFGPIFELDGKTGAVLRKFPETDSTEQIVAKSDTIWSSSKGPGDAQRISCIDRITGEIKWYSDAEFIASPLVANDTVTAYYNKKEIVCLETATGKEKWRVALPSSIKWSTMGRSRRRILIYKGTIVYCDRSVINSYSVDSGEMLWSVPAGGPLRPIDLFAANGCIWHGGGKGFIEGYDYKSGEVVHAIDPSEVKSKGHHKRCYPAKATEDWLISQFRGCEFISLKGKSHSQQDWTRGACSYGVMPANGQLYTPQHPCLCYGPAMMLNFNSYTTASKDELKAIGDSSSYGPIVKGPAYRESTGKEAIDSGSSWPMYRHDAKRTGSVDESVSGTLKQSWAIDLGDSLTPPVAAGGKVFVAAKNTHTLYALDTANGNIEWHYTANGTIDSPPAIYGSKVLFGSADGFIYCLSVSDGDLVWKRRLAPAKRFIANKGQIESAWPLHGSVLIYKDIAYTIAGRSSFVDGGLFIYGMDIQSGEVKYFHRFHTLSNKREDAEDENFLPAFHIEGSNSDLLVEQNDHIYLNQFIFTRELKPISRDYVTKEEVEGTRTLNMDQADYVDHEIFGLKWKGTKYSTTDLHTTRGKVKGHMGVRKSELHLSAKSGFLDASLYPRTYWIYADTWPGFQHTIMAPKSGQLLSIGNEKTYSMKMFNSRSVNSPKFNPEKGCLIVADNNNNEPIIDERAFLRDKGMGFTRSAPPVWHIWLKMRVKAMVLAGDALFISGKPDSFDKNNPYHPYKIHNCGIIQVYSKQDGKKIAEYKIEDPPIFDGLISAQGKLYYSSENGSLMCLE